MSPTPNTTHATFAISRMAARMTANVSALQRDAGLLTAAVVEAKQHASNCLQGAKQLKDASGAVNTCDTLVAWIDKVISWARDLVSVANHINLFGWLNWFLHDVNSAIDAIQAIADEIHNLCPAAEEVAGIVAKVVAIIDGICPLLSWL
ncbi:MAG TPA: hypothetical protein VFP94_04995 [Terriglobales bacterium]|nr:hypothetical protein [Terriglobales bacterium]